MLNFTNYKIFCFHFSANVEIKSHPKVLKIIFCNMNFKNLYVTTILPSYFNSWES